MARTSLSLAEQETIILYDNELDTASVYTHDKRLLSRLKDLAKKYPEQFVLESRNGRLQATYRIPKGCVTIRQPYSEERRAQQKEEAAKNGLPFATGATTFNRRREEEDDED